MNKKSVSRREAFRIMQRRRALAQRVDNARRAKRVFKVGGRKSWLWRSNPNRYDLFGVDRPRAVNRRAVARAAKREEKSFYGNKPLRHSANRRRLTGVEIMALKSGFVKNSGLPRDVFDFRAHIDRSLSFNENRRQLQRFSLPTAEDLAERYPTGFDFAGYERALRRR